MLELTGSMGGSSQRDPHPGRRPVIFHHLHFRATPAASQPLAPISPRNCRRRRAKFGKRGGGGGIGWEGEGEKQRTRARAADTDAAR